MAGEIISRAEARAQGLKRYFTGKPCKRGHVAERFVSGECVPCKLATNERWRRQNLDKKNAGRRRWIERNKEEFAASSKEYHRDWYARNRDEIRTRQREYNKSNPEVGRDSTRRWRDRNRDVARAANRQWYKNNPEKARELKRRRYAKKSEIILEQGRRWRRENPEAMRVLYNRRRALEVNAPGQHTPADLKDMLNAQNHRCANCDTDLRKTKMHLDHITPLSRGGSNSKENLQWLCALCNIRKKDKDPIQFAREQGRLL